MSVAATSSRTTTITFFPRMERPSIWQARVIPLDAGWHDAMWDLFSVTTIRPLADRGDRYTTRKKGSTVKVPIPAKRCSPGITPYELPAGGRRCRDDAMAHNVWGWLIADLDAVPMSVGEVLRICSAAFAGLKSAAFTTWSCEDGRASVRLVIPLRRPVTHAELTALWWWARRRLIVAGLPEDSAKGSEPANDSRALDGRLFYLPSVPADQKKGTEGWGGVAPRGYVSLDTDDLLDPDKVLDEARRIQAEDEPVHVTRWPSVPMPSSTTRRSKTSKKTRKSKSRQSAPTGPSAGGEQGSVRVNFDAVPMIGDGMSVRAWADVHLPHPGTEVAIGSVFDGAWVAEHPGGRASEGHSTQLHRDEDGHLWAHSWWSEANYFDVRGPSSRVTPEVQTHDQILSVTLPPGRIDEEVSGRLIREAWKRKGGSGGPRVVVLQTSIASGKTHLMGEVARSRRQQGEDVAAVSPLRSLTAALGARLGDLDYYEDVEGPLVGSVAVCFPSVPRVRTWKDIDVEGVIEDREISLLVVDEVEAMLRGLVGHLNSVQGRRAYLHLISLLRVAKHVMLADADAGPCTRQLLADAGVEAECVWLTQDPRPTYRWIPHPREGSLQLEVLKWASEGNRVGLAVASAGRAMAVGSLIASQSEARVGVISPRVGELATSDEIDRVCILASDGSIDEATSMGLTMTDLGWTEQIDVLIITSAAGTGVDIPGRWNRLAYIGSSGVLHTEPQVRQMIGRFVRGGGRVSSVTAEVLSQDQDLIPVHVFLPGGPPPEKWETDRDAVLRAWLRREDGLRRRAGLSMPSPEDLDTVRVGPNGALHRDPDTWMYARACATAYAANRADGAGWLRTALAERAEALGEPVEEADVDDRARDIEKATSRAVRTWRKDHETTIAENLNAAVVADDVIDEIRDRGPASPSEAKAVRRAAIEEFYGNAFDGKADDEQVELIRRDDRGRRRGALRRLAWTLASADEVEGEILQSLDMVDLEGKKGPNPRDLPARRVLGTWVRRYLAAVGLDLASVTDGTEVTVDMALAGTAWINGHGGVAGARMAVPGLRIPKDITEPAVGKRLVGDVLRYVGFGTTSEQVREGVGRRWRTSVDGADLARDDAAHYLDGLVHPTIEHPQRWSAAVEARMRVQQRHVEAAFREDDVPVAA